MKINKIKSNRIRIKMIKIVKIKIVVSLPCTFCYIEHEQAMSRAVLVCLSYHAMEDVPLKVSLVLTSMVLNGG